MIRLILIVETSIFFIYFLSSPFFSTLFVSPPFLSPLFLSSPFLSPLFLSSPFHFSIYLLSKGVHEREFVASFETSSQLGGWWGYAVVWDSESGNWETPSPHRICRWWVSRPTTTNANSGGRRGVYVSAASSLKSFLRSFPFTVPANVSQYFWLRTFFTCKSKSLTLLSDLRVW